MSNELVHNEANPISTTFFPPKPCFYHISMSQGYSSKSYFEGQPNSRVSKTTPLVQRFTRRTLRAQKSFVYDVMFHCSEKLQVKTQHKHRCLG